MNLTLEPGASLPSLPTGLASTRLSQVWRFRLLRLGGVLVTGMGGAILWQAVRLLRLQSGP